MGDSEEYTFSTDIEVHLRDIDDGNHVNNAVLVEYLEQARIEYLDELVDYRDRETYIVVAALEMQFHSPAEWKETVTVDLRIPELGTSSFRIEYRLRVGDTEIATAETLIVTYDREEAESIPVPSEWRDRIEADNGSFLDQAGPRDG